ncbi:MAG: EAL domain-containing response regulator, partial [Pseudomonadota bacterium]
QIFCNQWFCMNNSLAQLGVPSLLVIDDDPTTGLLVVRAAREAGYQAILVSNFEDFKSALSNNTAIVIVDVLMPDVDGVEIVRYLADEKASAGLVLTCGKDKRLLQSVEMLARAQKLWVVGTLKKPFSSSDLTDLLRDVEPEILQRTMQFPVLPSAKELKQGLDDGQFEVHYQPKVDLESLVPTSVEALVRWRHPRLGLLNPGRFISMCEDSDLITPLTEIVIHQSLSQCAEWQRQNLDLKVSINLSTRSLDNLDIPDVFDQMVRRYGVAPENIVLEVTEGWLQEKMVTALDILTRLRIKGFELSIDDFGTGYSSLQRLRNVPFSELKIDQSFVSGAHKDKDQETIVRSSIDLAKQLGLRTVAEGVETQDDWDLMSSIGCDEAQGFFISEALPGDSIGPWFNHWNKSLGAA